MEILFVLILIWIIVTFVGHLTWVIVAATLRILFGSQQDRTEVASPADDVAAAQRVINRMASALLISPQEAKQLRQKLGSLQQPAWKKQHAASEQYSSPAATTEQISDQVVDLASDIAPLSDQKVSQSTPDSSLPVAPSDPPTPLHPLDELIAERSQASDTPSAPRSPSVGDQSRSLNGGRDSQNLQDTAVTLAAGASTDSTLEPLQSPRASAGRTLAEFLADHNIRWGELIAGLLIVVCSIGLVVSLWSTLTQTHRVVPSLIFLGGNTAIFLAGLYTLFRWKLQDTSRATLVIATLLVPLGILAGLSTGSGIDSAAVMLNDPITLICIVGAGALYSFLLWHSSRALVGRRDAMAMTIGVAGPSAVLPFIPAALRTFEDSSGFICYLGSLAASIAVMWLFRHRRDARGNAANRRAMVLGVTTFSLAVLAGYTAMMLRELDSGWLAVSVATLPGLLVLAASAWTFSRDLKRPKLGLAGTVCSGLGIFAAMSLIVPMMVSSDWLWTWAISFAVASAVAAWATRSSLWTVIATVPIGLAFVLCSPSITSTIPWSELPIRNRLVGGEPMLATFAFGIAGAIAATILGKCVGGTSHLRKLLLIASACWIGVSTVNAVLLTFAPASWMGVVPAWGLSVFLLTYSVAIASLGATVPLPINKRYVALSGVVLQLTFWLSVFKPFLSGQSIVAIESLVRAVVATAVGTVLAAEFSWRFTDLSKAYRQIASFVLAIASCLTVYALFRSDGSMVATGFERLEPILTLAFASVAWLWIGLSLRDGVHFAMARGCLCVSAGLAGHVYFHEVLFTVEAWKSGQALWGWAGLGLSLVGLILIRNQVLVIVQKSLGDDKQDNQESAGTVSSWRFDLKSRLRWYHPHEHATDIASMGWLSQVSLALLTAAGFLGAWMLVVQVSSGLVYTIEPTIRLPLAVFAGGALVYLFLKPQQTDFVWGQEYFGAIYCAALCTWVGWQISTRVVIVPGEQLVWATSIAAGGCLVWGLLAGHRSIGQSSTGKRIADHLLTSIGFVWVIASSIALLKSGWWMLVVNHETPDIFITCSVATWWAIAAIASTWQTIRHRSKDYGSIVAVLVPAVVILVCPLLDPARWWIWIQSASIASIGLVIIASVGIAYRRNSPSASNQSNVGDNAGVRRIAEWSFVIGIATGIITSTGVIAGVIVGDVRWLELHNPIGLVLSALTIGMLLRWDRLDAALRLPQIAIPWPVLVSLASGHLAVLANQFMAISLPIVAWLSIIWICTSMISGVDLVCRAISHQSIDRFSRWHACGLIVASSVLCLFHGGIPHHDSIGIVSCAVGGLLVALRSTYAYRQESAEVATGRLSVVAARIFCWFVIAAGSVFVVELVDTATVSGTKIFTALLVWFASWVVIWRVISPEGTWSEQTSKRPGAMLADIELSWVVATMLIAETAATLVFPNDAVSLSIMHDPLLWGRIVSVVVVLLTVGMRHRRKSVLEHAALGSIALAVLIGLRVGVDELADSNVMISIGGMTTAVIFSILVFCASAIRIPINRLSRSWRGLNPASTPHIVSTTRIIRSLTNVAPIVLVATVSSAVWLLIEFNQQRIVPIAVSAVALTAVCLAELAERLNRSHLRHTAVTIAMASVAMWASCRVVVDAFPLLSLSTRWFVAWVLLAVALAFALPKLLPEAMLSRWGNALRKGWCIAVALAAGSLVTTLIQQAMVRLSGQTELLNRSLYLGMAATLGILCIASTLAGILSGPGFSYRQSWKLTNRQRAALVVAAQIFGGLTWFHLFLCKSPLASLGLRAYWPYIVMTLSFASVGITEWARRRGDEVLTKTLRKTALFLPLVPVIGFWLSGSWVTSMFGESDSSAWTYIQGRVSYQAILVAAALYYGVVSFLWKSGRARLVSIVMGNLALWVILIQTPNWDFLSHPQAWLIPPALCVLAATHFYREALGANTASGIRYAATLSIYITSTADMLVQGIGETIWGPIILILLALLGATAGVAFRIRPFLYLGTTFVFIGVTSMVWHAQTQIGAVWPWWVFGISTGVLLMIGLMAIEKNKPKLRQIASSLQQWDA